MFRYLVSLTLVLMVPLLAYGQHHPGHAGPPQHSGNFHRPPGVHPMAPHGHNGIPNYHQRFGRPFRNGIYYPGFRHNHWTYTYWDRRYGTYLYYDPGVQQYYYWCPPYNAYLPISYVPMGTYAFPYDPNPQPPADLPVLPDK